MASNNTYDGPTVTLALKDTGYDNIIHFPTRPVLDSELNGATDLSSSKLQDFVRSRVPSGWLEASFSKGLDLSGSSYGICQTDEPNSFKVSSTKETPMLVNVNGWLLQLGGSFINEDNKLKINLPSPPSSSSRSDLVFLEVWKKQIAPNSTDGKPTTDTIYKFGNTQYGGDNLPDQIFNPAININTTERIQIQYRIRIVTGPDFLNHPEGITDANSVNAQGSNSSPVSNYPFTNAGEDWDDFGLYIAGDGSSDSREDLGTVDGYVYAIPMFRVHRRNTGGFSTANQNGSSLSITSNLVSDRPDGFYNDQITLSDIEDLRHSVSFCNFNYKNILEKTVDEIYSGEYSHLLTRSLLEGNFESADQALYINRISASSVPNTDTLRNPSTPQRYFSDVEKDVLMPTSRTTANKTFGLAGSDWTSGDQVTVNAPSQVSRSTSSIGLSTPKVFFSESNQGPIVEAVGTWSGLGTSSALFTLGSNPQLSNQVLYITYTLSYNRIGDKLTKPVKDMLRVQDLLRGENWGFISVTDFDPSSLGNQYRVSRRITPRSVSASFPDYAYTYRLDKVLRNLGMSTVYSYHINATGNTNIFTIPANIINTNDVGYVQRVTNMNTNADLNILSMFKNLDGSIQVTLQQSPNAVVRFDLALKGGVIEYDPRTQSIIDIGRVDFYSINGNGTDEIVLKGSTIGQDPTNIIIDSQTTFNFQNQASNRYTCYVDNQIRFVDVEIEEDTSLIKLKFDSAVAVSSVIDIALMTTYNPTSADDLNIYYTYSEYKGITSNINFGTSSISSEVIYHNNSLDIVTNGTGALNTSNFLPRKYEPIIPKLPIVNSADYGDFTSTEHNKRIIIGGSYTSPTDYNAPYYSGGDNYMTKQGVIQNKGTNSGGRFINSAEEGEGGLHKLIVGHLVEMVKSDSSSNFLPGEIAVRIETNYLNNTTSNRITNSDSGDNTNSFDLYKVEGRPLIKLNTK